MRTNRLLFLVLFLLGGVIAARAQTLTVTPSVTTYSAGGGTLTLSVQLTYPGSLSALGVQMSAPSGWSFGGATGANPPAIFPSNVTTGLFEFAYLTVPASPVSFTITANYPAGGTGNRTFTGITAILRDAAGGARVDATAADIVIAAPAGSTGGGSGGSGGGGGGVVVVAPVIGVQPTGASVVVGGNVTLSVLASGTEPLSYQWRKDGVPLVGRTASVLSLANVATTDGGTYSVVVSNSGGSATSNGAVVAVAAKLVAPSISVSPRDFTGTIGTPATLAVVASGSDPLAYQWRKNDVPMIGATSATLALAGLASDSGSYTVTVSNSAGVVTSGGATVRYAAAPAGLAIVQQPVGKSLAAGESASLAVSATGTGTLTYQWFKDGVALGGQTTSELALRDVTPATAGGYQVRISAGADSVASAVAQVTVANRAAAPVLTSQPAPVAALLGENVVFSVVAAGNPAPAYQWRKNGLAVAGATNSSLTLTAVQTGDVGAYDVVVSNALGTASSSLASLGVSATPQAPTISRQPVSMALAVGRTARLSVTATGAPAPIYQWRLNGAPVSGVTARELVLANLSAAQAGVYSVAVSNSAGNVVSNDAVVTAFNRSYAGSYFGSLPGGGGFALQIRDDNTGVFLAYAAAAATGYVQRTVAVDENGRFQFSSGGLGGPASAALAPATLPATAAAVADATFDGVIAAGGAISGTVSGGVSGQLAGTRANDAGASSAVAGFYQVAAAGNAAQAFAIVGPGGRAFVLTQSGAVGEGAEGTVDGAGQIAVSTPSQSTVSLQVSAENGAASGTVRDARGAQTPLSGYSEQAAARADQRLVNISTRTTVGAGDDGVAIVGFVITGVESKPVLIRAVGPTLRSFGVSTALGAPRLSLVRNGVTVAANTGWSSAANSLEIAAATTRAGAFALVAGSADSAVLATLPPGSYTAVVSAADGRAGVGLIEVYDLGGASNDQKLVNISTRAGAGTGDATLIAGVVVSGDSPKRVLIRAAGPVLTGFGVSGVLSRPVLRIFSGDRVVAENAGWSTSSDASMIAEASARVGAFAFPASGADAAIIVNLAPGTYTAQASSANGATGTALIEVYEVP